MKLALPRRFGMAPGLLCSLLLHALLLLAWWLWPAPAPAPPPPLSAELPVELVPDSDPGVSAPAAAVTLAQHPLALPQPSRPPPSLPEEVSRAAPTEDPLARQLQRLAQLRIASPAATASNGTAGASGRASTGAGYGLGDYIKAQIEKRWIVRDSALLRNDWVVRIHILVNSDGTVGRADILDDPRLLGDREFRDFALSARNAVILSSPLALPPGLPEQIQDLVLDFNPRQVQQ